MPKSKRKKVASRRAVRSRTAKPRAASRRLAIEVALAGLAHDIRTPLTGILSLASLLEASDLPEQERRWAASIRGAAEHLAQLTTVVVDAAKADAGKLVLRREPFAPRELADAVAASLAARAEAKGLQTSVSIAKRLPASLNGDAVRLRAALENLIDNAIKFTERGRIAFKVSSASAARGRVRLTFEIADSGIGITAADLKRLFRPFAQASEDVARRYGGAGLGLASVKRIAAAMGGRLDVQSQPGHGSTFRLSVTLDPLKTVPARTARERRAPSRRSLRVLSVEDNPYGRIVLKAVLGELGHRLSFAGGGEAAVREVTRGGFDAVLMDVALADIDGFEAARRIRALPLPEGRIPIIGLSGRDSDGDAAAARMAGMNGYLRKPASPAELDEALNALVTRGRRKSRS